MVLEVRILGGKSQEGEGKKGQGFKILWDPADCVRKHQKRVSCQDLLTGWGPKPVLAGL